MTSRCLHASFHEAVTILGNHALRNENRNRDRRLVPADQRRRKHSGADRRLPRPIRPRGDDRRATRLPYHPLPELSRNPHRRATHGGSLAQAPVLPATGGAYRDRGSDRIRRTALLPEERLALHDLLSHAVSAVPEVPLADTAVALVRGAAPLSRGRAPLHGEHPVGRERAPRARLP